METSRRHITALRMSGGNNLYDFFFYWLAKVKRELRL
jgi:hypothetical protein